MHEHLYDCSYTHSESIGKGKKNNLQYVYEHSYMCFKLYIATSLPGGASMPQISRNLRIVISLKIMLESLCLILWTHCIHYFSLYKCHIYILTYPLATAADACSTVNIRKSEGSLQVTWHHLSQIQSNHIQLVSQPREQIKPVQLHMVSAEDIQTKSLAHPNVQYQKRKNICTCVSSSWRYDAACPLYQKAPLSSIQHGNAP